MFWRNKQDLRATTPARDTPPVKAPSGFFSTDVLDGFSGKLHREAMSARLEKSFALMEAKFKQVNNANLGVAMDAAVKTALDNSIDQVKAFASAGGSGVMPIQQLDWYSNQGFIGWQLCAIIGQQWLVNKALKMPFLDATRHWFERSTTDDVKVDPKNFTKLRKLDKKFKLRKNLIEHGKFARMFGIRHSIPIIEGIDYEAPFNPDGIKPGSFKGWTQIDPYWIAPEFNLPDASQPWNPHFYEPTWWRIGNMRIHRSHFIISRNGNDLADILKPSYFYGGIPTTQLIYERIYAAERTANEAPLLALSKRQMVLKTDVSKALADFPTFQAKMEQWTQMMANWAVKIIGNGAPGEGEEIQQFETSLAALDETIMSQYQLVAAIAEVPATKLLGTSPKGFNASGEYENDSYHEFLESLQEDELTPFVDRHTLCLQRSEGIMPDVEFETTWKAVDTPSAKEQAEINKIKADTDKVLGDLGAVDGYDARQRISKDPDSGYNGIPEVVPDGPGDREAQQEAEEALEQPVLARAKPGEKN